MGTLLIPPSFAKGVAPLQILKWHVVWPNTSLKLLISKSYDTLIVTQWESSDILTLFWRGQRGRERNINIPLLFEIQSGNENKDSEAKMFVSHNKEKKNQNSP